MSGVIAGGPGAIAWGSVYATGPRIWYSADGLDWSRATVEAANDADPDQYNPGAVLDMTAGGPGFVAVGSYFRSGGDGNTSMVWTSVDGLSWRRVASGPVFERSRMDSVVAWGGQLLAFGCANISPTDCETQLTDTTWERHPRVWASSDGLTWRIIELSLPVGVVGVENPIIATDRLWGTEVVSGSPTAWLTSTDGQTWVRSRLPLIRWPTIARLYPLADAIYATVRPWPLPAPDFTPPPEPAGRLASGVYVATDAGTWTLRSRGLTTVGEDLIAIGDTLIMVGDDGAGNERCWATCQAVGWRSIDGGVTWHEVPADTVGGTMTSVTALPDGTLVAVGRKVDAQGEPSTAAWVSRSETQP